MGEGRKTVSRSMVAQGKEVWRPVTVALLGLEGEEAVGVLAERGIRRVWDWKGVEADGREEGGWFSASEELDGSGVTC